LGKRIDGNIDTVPKADSTTFKCLREGEHPVEFIWTADESESLSSVTVTEAVIHPWSDARLQAAQRESCPVGSPRACSTS
jgi:hypothetical protein